MLLFHSVDSVAAVEEELRALSVGGGGSNGGGGEDGSGQGTYLRLQVSAVVMPSWIFRLTLPLTPMSPSRLLSLDGAARY
eukprot:SAG11_NODE_4275_length_1972_cov_1.985585_3_plen_80_part_00